jgi:hypothetical protein
MGQCKLTCVDSGADMTNETAKVLLMILVLGSLEAAIHLPPMWKSRHWTFLGRAVARAWSAMASTGHTPQPAVLKRRFRGRRVSH